MRQMKKVPCRPSGALSGGLFGDELSSTVNHSPTLLNPPIPVRHPAALSVNSTYCVPTMNGSGMMNNQRGTCNNGFHWNGAASRLERGTGLSMRYPPAPDHPTINLAARRARIRLKRPLRRLGGKRRYERFSAWEFICLMNLLVKQSKNYLPRTDPRWNGI